MKRGIAISGGGAFGAFTAGKLFVRKPDYTIGHGISTGALMILAILSRQWGILEMYTLVNDSMIYSLNPWTRSGMPRIWLWIIRSILSLFVDKIKTIGESHSLRVLIGSVYTRDVYDFILSQERKAIVSAYSLTYDEIYQARNNKLSYNKFLDFIYASSCAGPIMSIPSFERTELSSKIEEWTDAGIVDNNNAALLFEEGCTHVDLYLHKKRHIIKRPKKPVKNVFHYCIRWVLGMFEGNVNADIKAAIKAAEHHKARLVIHYIPADIASDNQFIFNTDRMTHYFMEGQRLAFEKSLIETYDFTKK